MENIIFYFTGTGNSLVVARDIADQMGNTKLLSIADAIKEEAIDLSYERIGFVFPVYYSSIPSIVERFIKRLHFKENQYIFSVVTLGGVSEMALWQLSHCIKEQNGLLSSGFKILMPGNYIIKYGAYRSIIQRKLIKREKRRVRVISMVIMEKRKVHIPRRDLLSMASSETLIKMISEIGKNAQNFHINSQCTGCGICERLCPTDNVKLEHGRPKWGIDCEACMACIQWCPTQAIEYANKTEKRKRYHHPEIKSSDIMPHSKGM